jgi:hypothetical protein
MMGAWTEECLLEDVIFRLDLGALIAVRICFMRDLWLGSLKMRKESVLGSSFYTSKI